MYKNFVSLTSSQSPSINPYEIRTFIGESNKPPHPEWHVDDPSAYQRDCDALESTNINKVLTLQEEIHKIYKKTRQNNILLNPFRKKCKKSDRFTACVIPRRTPEQLRLHSKMCENYLKVKYANKEKAHDIGDLYLNHTNLIALKDPDVGPLSQENVEKNESKDDESILPELASPEYSREFIYVAPKSLLALKQPKSGVFVNETERPQIGNFDEFSYSAYNPRVLQKRLDAQNVKNIDLIPCKNNKDMWTWNIGLQKTDSELNQAFVAAAVPKFECNNLELAAYRIPKDLDKTFSAVIIFGTKGVKPQPIPMKKPHFRRPLEIACLYIAFVEGYRLNADFWTFETLDNIMKMAIKLIKDCVKLNYKSKDNDFDIITQIKARKAAFNIKVHFAGPLKSEPNIYKALSIFFSKHNACILCSNKLYLLIWKRFKNSFFIYDPNGRGENCTRDFEHGKSALLSTHHVEHLVHFIVNISQTSLEDEFKLYEIFLTSYGKILDPLPKKPFPKTFHKQWAVVNESYAVIPGCNNGLSQPNTAAAHNPSMLISVMAILYSHIERGNTWKPDQVDELIRLGTAYHKSLRRKLKLKESQQVTIIDLPEKYVLGTFKASLKKTPFMYTGTMTDFCENFMDSILISGMQELFKSNWEAALLQIDNSVLGIWRDNELFYLYDPFRRGKVGQVLHPEDYRTTGTAILQMHANLESLLKILYQNAIKMRRGGKFFIHVVTVGCIKPIMDGKQRKLRYPKLKLTPETYVQPAENLGEVKNSKEGEINKEGVLSQQSEEKDKKSNKSKKPKDKDKKKKLIKECSIGSLNEKERAIVIRSAEVVAPVLDSIICEIVGKFPETASRPRPYKSAARVLLRSDKEYLENLKYLVKHEEDPDNVELSFKTQQEESAAIISLKEELKLPSNFKSLPDGSWIILGLQPVFRLKEEELKVMGFLSAIVSAALTARYKISSWTPKLIDYALDSVENFGEGFQTYQYALGALLQKSMPQLSLGGRLFQLNVQKILRSDAENSLRQVLIESLINFNRLVVICPKHSCLIIKRYNFLYMFCGFPVNSVGYRMQTIGPGCMMRFVELDSLIRRIEFGCNPLGCDISNYVVVPLKVYDVTPEPTRRYRAWPKNIEKQMYNAALYEKTRIEESKKSKMNFIEKELAGEDHRIKGFQATRSKNNTLKIKSSKGTMGNEIVNDKVNDIEIGQVEDEECIVEAKHNFDSQLEAAKEDERLKPHPIVYGYRMREKDLLYKIQGSKALEGRTNCVDNEVKPCWFASALAILYAILKPLNEWTSHRVDQVIDSTLILSDKIEDMSKLPERILKNVSVDEYIFDILVKVYNSSDLIGHLENQLERLLSHNKYVIFQTHNCSYAVSRDGTYYNLFDPYPSMALMDSVKKEPEKISTEDRKRLHKYYETSKLYGERNTASWILFANIKSMIEYLNDRACTKTWKKDRAYTFMIMKVLSYKKAPQIAFVLQLLTDIQICNVDDEHEAAICAHNESVSWLEHCLPIWSRLNRRNAAGRYRGMALTKLKDYDIEIDQRLWSLWGNLHPQAPVFDVLTRGKQYLACCVISLCATSLYRLIDWSPHFLDSIIVNGDRYLRQSVQTIKCDDYQLSLEDLDVECMLEDTKFDIHIEIVAYGKLYTRPFYSRMNLAEALMYFFNFFKFGILQCFKKCLAIGFISGHDGGYFMFDCASRDNPLFPNGQGACYLLRTKYLQILLYCIVVTLNVPYYNIDFTLHKVNFQIKNREGNKNQESPEGR